MGDPPTESGTPLGECAQCGGEAEVALVKRGTDEVWDTACTECATMALNGYAGLIEYPLDQAPGAPWE